MNGAAFDEDSESNSRYYDYGHHQAYDTHYDDADYYDDYYYNYDHQGRHHNERHYYDNDYDNV